MSGMSTLTRRPVLVALATLVQLTLLVPLAVAGQLSARLTGEEVLLEVAPLDPVDPFRGAYVALDYPGLPDAAPDDSGSTGPSGRTTVYVPLVPDGELHRGTAALAEPPAEGPYLRCEDLGWRLSCGIDSWFLPQADALALERAVEQGRVVARVRVDGRGNAALVDVAVSEEAPGAGTAGSARGAGR